MRIRIARTDDGAAVARLLRQLGYPQDGTATTAARIDSWDGDPSSAAYVAEGDGGVLGLVAVHVCPYFERAGGWARIVALVVSDQARGRGIGGRLLEAAESFAAARGCARMEVTSADHRRSAHEFYRRRGYVGETGRSTRFVRDLEDTDGHDDPSMPSS